MEESRKTKKQLEKEAEQRERANRSFLRGSERLIQWMAFKDFLLNDFYQSLLDLSTAREDQGEPDNFGFSIYLYNTNISHRHPSLSLSCAGLGGLQHLLYWATQWLNDEFGMSKGEQWPSTEDPELIESLSVGEEMESGCLRETLDGFSEACEAVGALDDIYVNLFIAFYGSKGEMPSGLDFGCIETESLHYPDSLKKMFQVLLDDMTDN